MAGPAQPDRLAVTKALTAVDPDNAELAAARGASVPVEAWQQLIADSAVGKTLVGVAGTHGKSTTSGWLVHVLAEAGLDPCAIVGALLPGSLTGDLPSTARWGLGQPFVVEADEYAGNFDPYRPGLAVLTSVEWDHPDVFADRAAVVAAFAAWLGRAGGAIRRPVLVANLGDPGVAEVVDRLRGWTGDVLGTRLATGLPGSRRPGGWLVGTIEEADPAGTSLRLEGSALAAPLTARLRLAGGFDSSGTKKSGARSTAGSTR